MKSKIFIFICLLISLSACQIDKRLYRNGYSLISGHDTKHQSEKSNINHEDICTESPLEDEIKISAISTISRINTSDSTIKIAESQSDEMIYCCNNPLDVSTESRASDFKNVFGHNSKSVSASYADDPPKTHWAGIVSFCLIFAAIACIFLFALSFPLSITSIIFGAIAINKTEKSPDKYKNKVFAIVGVAACSLLLITEILLYAYVIFFIL